MINNDVLRRLRYTFNLSDAQMITVFALADHTANRSEISNWLKKPEDADAVEITDTEFALFLNGFINLKRGKKDGEQPEPEHTLTNNIIFTKLKIALNLKSEDILDIVQMANFTLSKHELSALFRKPGHKHHRVCNDQLLRYFLTGLQQKYRTSDI